MLFGCPEKCWWKWGFSPRPCRRCEASSSPCCEGHALIHSLLDWAGWMPPSGCSLMRQGSCARSFSPPRPHFGPPPAPPSGSQSGEIDGGSSWSVFEEAALDLVRLSAARSHWQAAVSAEPLIERLGLAGLCDTSLLMPTGPADLPTPSLHHLHPAPPPSCTPLRRH